MMRWKALPKGCFSDIHWARPGATLGFDPYLVWAEATHFSAFGLQQKPAWLPVIMELAPGATVARLVQAGSPRWLRVPDAYHGAGAPQGLRYCTARVGPKFMAELRRGGRLHGLVQRFELGLPLAARRAPAPEMVRTTRVLAPAQRLRGKVLGLIDGGLAFAHANFLHAGKARTRFFWRQDANGVGQVPHGLGYGHELTAADIDAAMARHTQGGWLDEDGLYRALGLHDLRLFANHGTHVMDLAAGPRTLGAQVAGLPPERDAPPSWALAGDAASRAPLLAVQLDWANILDTSGGSMNVSILDALIYMLSRCADDASLVVNLSWGTLAGPHDGSSVLEAAMDQLITLRQGRLQIVVPAGNAYQSRTHANVTLGPGQSAALHWNLPPDDTTPSLMEIWLPAGARGVEIVVTPPGGRPSLPARSAGQSGLWTDAGEQALCTLVWPERVATGTRGSCALLALAPSFSFAPEIATAPSGRWQVALHNRGPEAVTLDAYIERDDVAMGQHTGARQSRFEDTRYDLSGNPDSWVDRPVPVTQQLEATLIRRSGSFNSLSTGRHTVTAGGRDLRDGRWSLYSPQRPDPDAQRPRRPGVVIEPQRQAASDEDPALPGVRAAGTRTGSVVRLVGTSSSAPQVAREVFNAL